MGGGTVVTEHRTIALDNCEDHRTIVGMTGRILKHRVMRLRTSTYCPSKRCVCVRARA